MNENGEKFLTELQSLCEKHSVLVVEEWTGEDDDIFVGVHFQGPDYWIPISDTLLDKED